MTKSRRRSGNGATAPRPRRRVAPQRADLPDATGFPVVGIGASAGGLDAFQKFFDALPPDSGMAFILVQHLEPKHPSMMVELLAGHTAMKVQQAAEGMKIEPDRIYVIPPGVYLSISGDALHLSEPRERHGSRMPFDFLLNSMATEIGERAISVILSGTGTDGSHALKAVKEKGGLVIAQDPDEAAYDGMPRSAIATGAVDHVLPVAEIPQVLFRYDRRMAQIHTKNGSSQQDLPSDWLLKIIKHLRTNTAYDFTLYKLGTLQRRIERRMATAAFETADMDRYLEFLRSDPVECDLLSKDLLINVTSFCRDTKVFDLLAATIIPDLIRSHPLDQPLRIWVAGCSTGEETYSLAMLFREQITLAKRSIKLQVLEVKKPADLDDAFSALSGRPQALILLPSPMIYNQSARLARLAAKHDLLAVSMAREFAEAGGMLAYGPERASAWERGGVFVARILEGTSPAVLPVEQPIKIQLVVNMKTAKALGVTVPESIFLRADEVLE